MAKSGQARVLTSAQIAQLFGVIQHHRHPEKNTAIMQISFKLGLRVQEIALLQIKEVAKLNAMGTDFELLEIMALPAAYTKGANAAGRSKSRYNRKTISFSIEEFKRIVRQVEQLGNNGVSVNYEDFLPPVKARTGKSRDLPMRNSELREALEEYLRCRLDKAGSLKPTNPLFVTQKGGSYSANTLQEHMALMLQGWAGVEKASSHSGRRSVITHIIHSQKKPLKVAQKIAGHVNPSTTLIYDEPPEGEIGDALEDLTFE